MDATETNPNITERSSLLMFGAHSNCRRPYHTKNGDENQCWSTPETI